jgi:hypothetical protein
LPIRLMLREYGDLSQRLVRADRVRQRNKDSPSPAEHCHSGRLNSTFGLFVNSTILNAR